jgi:flagellar FliJ protein
MARPFRLQTLLDLGAQRLDAAALELQKLNGAWRQAQSKLDQLLGFQAEYEAARAQAMAQGIEADRLRDFQRFLTKLRLAIQAQGAEAERCQQAWMQQHRVWLELRQREQALVALRERHAQAEAVRERRREQKEQDEFALRTRKENPSDPS